MFGWLFLLAYSVLKKNLCKDTYEFRKIKVLKFCMEGGVGSKLTFKQTLEALWIW